MATKRPTANLFAMPAPLRYLLIRESISLRRPSTRYASTSSASSRAESLPPPVLSFCPGPSNDPSPRALPAPPPAESTLHSVNTLFTSTTQQLLWTAPRFFDIPFNNLVPEVCILGRSNVGKSTLLNALGGAVSSVARRVHGQTARKAGMAITSPTAGCTKLMNAYAFGPPTSGPVLLPSLPKTLTSLIPSESDLQRLINTTTTPTSSRRTRRSGSKSSLPINVALSPAERRQLLLDTHLQSLYRPPIPRSLIILDTPGYGLNSQQTWGVELSKYLKRRIMLRGAVVLIDSVAGIKKGDQMALALLRDHNVRTTIVLTKADKVRSRPGHINQVCLDVWEELRRIEGKGHGHGARWSEGNGWEREVWVTGAGDLKSANGVESNNVTGARMAICKMAGLVADDRREEIVVPESAKPPTGRIVTFEEIERMMSEQARSTVQVPAGGGRVRRPRASVSF